MITYLEKILNLIGIQNSDQVALTLFIGYAEPSSAHTSHSVAPPLQDELYNKYNVQSKENYTLTTKINEDGITISTYDDDINMVSLLSGNDSNIILFISKNDNSVNLIPLIHNNIHLNLFEFALKTIENIKDTYSLLHIFLKDSFRYNIYTSPTRLESLTKNTYYLPIYDLYILRFGESIFDDYGFIQYDSEDKTINQYALIHHNKNKDIVKYVKVKKTYIYKYLVDASFRLDLNNKYSKKTLYQIIEPYFDKPIVEFINHFITEYDTELKLFNEIYIDLMKDLGINSMYMMEYYKVL